MSYADSALVGPAQQLDRMNVVWSPPLLSSPLQSKVPLPPTSRSFLPSFLRIIRSRTNERPSEPAGLLSPPSLLPSSFVLSFFLLPPSTSTDTAFAPPLLQLRFPIPPYFVVPFCLGKRPRLSVLKTSLFPRFSRRLQL